VRACSAHDEPSLNRSKHRCFIGTGPPKHEAGAADRSISGFVTWVSLVWRNLLRRPARTALTTAGVSVGVGLIVALLSLSAGVEKTAGELIHVGRSDFGVFQSDVSDFSRSLLPESLAGRIATITGVAETDSGHGSSFGSDLC
jgi:hypothetical protein